TTFSNSEAILCWRHRCSPGCAKLSRWICHFAPYLNCQQLRGWLPWLLEFVKATKACKNRLSSPLHATVICHCLSPRKECGFLINWSLTVLYTTFHKPSACVVCCRSRRWRRHLTRSCDGTKFCAQDFPLSRISQYR